MLFNSISFLIFFPLVFFGYWALPAKFRPALLLAASCYFYMVFVPYYILVLFALITIDFFLAHAIERAVGRRQRFYFIAGILSNVAFLFVFKYFNFFNDNITSLAYFLGWDYSLSALSLLLPLGLSFHIFQAISYLIEVRKGRYKAETNYLSFSLYVMFFPQLVAGPIERPAHLLPQLKTAHDFNITKVVSGLEQMFRGFFKKLVIATPLAILVDFVYAHTETSQGPVLLLAAVLFYFVLYADFSGYTDIALGSARMLGIELVQNFDQPYLSRSIAEFWRRWHMSLSNWFRDYVFYPLAWKWGPWGKSGLYAAIIATFTLMGVWHGAGWNFLIMGALFGMYISFGQYSAPLRDKMWQSLRLERIPGLRLVVQITITFILTALTWIFFRVQDLSQALAIMKGILTRWGADAFSFLTCSNFCAFYQLGIGKKELAIALVSLAILLVYESVQSSRIHVPKFLTIRSFRWFFYYVIIFWILYFGSFVPKSFIYFQF